MPTIAYDRVVDLSQEISPTMQAYPTDPRPAFVPWATRRVHGYLSESLFLSSHAGTHVDAPWHFRPEGRRVHELAADRFVRPAHLLDLRPAKARARITAKALSTAAKEAGAALRHGDAVLLRTGWEAKRGKDAYVHDNPGLTAEGAAWIVRSGAGLVGLDTISADLPTATEYPAHHALAAADVPILENLANLGAIRSSSFLLVALPLRLRSATGSPVRAIALVKD